MLVLICIDVCMVCVCVYVCNSLGATYLYLCRFLSKVSHVKAGVRQLRKLLDKVSRKARRAAAHAQKHCSMFQVALSMVRKKEEDPSCYTLQLS